MMIPDCALNGQHISFTDASWYCAMLKTKLTYLEGPKTQLKSDHTPKSILSSKHYGVGVVLQVHLSSTNVVHDSHRRMTAELPTGPASEPLANTLWLATGASP